MNRPSISGALWTHGTLWALLVSSLLLGVPGEGVEAQVRGGGQQSVAELRQRVQARFQERVRQELELSEEEAGELRAISEEFNLRRRELSLEEQQIRLAVQRYMRGFGEEDPEALLQQTVDLREREVRLYVEELDRLGEILSADQLLRFGFLREQLAERIRQLTAQARQRRSGSLP